MRRSFWYKIVAYENAYSFLEKSRKPIFYPKKRFLVHHTPPELDKIFHGPSNLVCLLVIVQNWFTGFNRKFVGWVKIWCHYIEFWVKWVSCANFQRDPQIGKFWLFLLGSRFRPHTYWVIWETQWASFLCSIVCHNFVGNSQCILMVLKAF